MSEALIDTPPATPAPPSGSEPSAEQVIAERYRLVRKLGEGGMGAVFLAEHVHMRKRFALKLLLPEAMSSPEIVARFEREAIAAGNIEHPGVCAATDFGRLPDGSFFLVLEYVDGQSLRKAIGEGPMPPQRAVSIARQILLALGAAHAKGVVHRDIKPENVMLTTGTAGEDVVKVLDFGIAKIDANSLGEGQGTALTRMGAIYGTPAYMAPEQAMGKAIDQRVDLYALGVMLHEMIAGVPPFQGEGVVILAKHVNEPPPRLVSPLDPNAVSDELRAFVARLLAKKADDRPADAAQAVAELDAARATLVAFGGGSGIFPPAGSVAGVTFTTSAGATAATSAGATAPTMAGAPSVVGAEMASAATVYGEVSPTPPPVAIKKSPLDAIEQKLAPLAKRAGVPAKHLMFVFAGLGALFFILLVVIIARPSRSDDDDAERRPKKRSSPAAQVEPTATTKPTATSTGTSTAAPVASTSPSSKPSGGSGGSGGGGGIKGLGRKIKGLF